MFTTTHQWLCWGSHHVEVGRANAKQKCILNLGILQCGVRILCLGQCIVQESQNVLRMSSSVSVGECERETERERERKKERKKERERECAGGSVGVCVCVCVCVCGGVVAV